MGKRGIVLLHVMLMAVLVAIVAATLMHLALLRYTVTARANFHSQELRDDQGALALLYSHWNATNFCASVLPYYTCNGNGGAGYAPPLTVTDNSCSCTCTAQPAYAKIFPPTITGSQPTGGVVGATWGCTMTLPSYDRMQ